MSPRKRTIGKRTKKEANFQTVKKLAESGYKNVEIARMLEIHRTTVGRYLEQADRDSIVREARIRVIQEALAEHFADLCKVAQRFKESVHIVQPRDGLVLDSGISRQLRISVDKVGSRDIMLNITQNGELTDLHLSVEDDLLFACLKQHTKASWLWDAFEQWKQNSQQYMSNLTRFHNLLKQEAEEKSGQKVVEENDRYGLTKHFPKTIYNNVCTHVFFGFEEFGEGAYGIIQLINDLYDLALGGLAIASAEQKEILESCWQIHQSMIQHYQKPENRPEELSSAVQVYFLLKEMEQKITTELEKLVLKRTFHGKCDICPD